MPVDVATRIRRLFGLFLLAFLMLVGWQSYWHLGGAEQYLLLPSNRRGMRAERSTPRGAILDHQGRKLAWTDGGTRRYADAVATAPVLGYLDPRYGRTGVEGQWNPELSGLSARFSPDEFRRIVDGTPRRGKEVVLTLDLALQQAAMAALDGRPGAVVALDPPTGAILALASSPSYDPRRIGEDFDRLTQSGTGALRNRAVQDHYPPGSTMKILTAAAGIMSGHNEATRFTCPGTSRIYGVTVKDYHGHVHGHIAMDVALTQSCNNYFARLAVETGADKFRATARAYGFDVPWWTRLRDRRQIPIALVPSSLTPHPDDPIPDGELAHMGFGQSTVVATPLQMAMITAAIANHGQMMTPYLVSAVRSDGVIVQRFASRTLGFPQDAPTCDRLAAMMRHVVTRGTAQGADVRGVTVYGKTGTAEHGGRGGDHAWFVGFARHNEPGKQIAFAVIIERGGTGGRVAVPVAARLLNAWAK